MKKIVVGLILALSSHCIYAQKDVIINEARVRATVPGQKTAAVFMEILSSKNGALTKVETKIAKAELHEMKMQDDVMKMRPVEEIVFKANQPLFLRPGGLHIMLLDLKKSLKVGGKVHLKLTFKYADGSKDHVKVKADVVEKISQNDHAMMH